MSVDVATPAMARVQDAGRARPAELAEDAPGLLDPRRLLSLFLRRIWVFAALAAPVLLGSVLYLALAPPQYTASAKVMLDTRDARVTQDEQVLSPLKADSEIVDSEVEVLRSRHLAEAVIADLRLERDPEFNPKGLDASAPGPGLNRVVDEVLDRQRIKRTGLTYVIQIGFESRDPQKAALIANKFAELYLVQQREAKAKATDEASRWLSGRLEQLRAQVIADEAAVQRFRIANNLMSASGATFAEQEISVYNQRLSEARAQLAEDEARLRTARAQMRQGSAGDDVGEALSSPVVQNLREQRVKLSTRVADLEGRYGDLHPEMARARRELNDVDEAIRSEIGRIVSNLEAKAEVSRQRAAAIGGSLGSAQGALAANNRAMVRLNELERTAEASRTLYESYLNRFKQTSTQSGLEKSDASLISPARAPTEPSSPNVPLTLAFGAVLALGAGLAGVVASERIDATLASGDDVRRKLGVRYLGSIPSLDSTDAANSGSPVDYVVERPLSVIAEAFRNLRTSIRYACGKEAGQVLAISSALPSEGKTTSSISLARVSALQGLKVIIVDCDLRQPAVNGALGLEAPEAGLLEVLHGEAPLESAVTVDTASGAHILQLRDPLATSEDVFGGAGMDRLLESLRERYDLIVLDTAPILALADTRTLASKVDALVVLAHWRKTPAHAILAAIRMINSAGAQVCGVALTQVDLKRQERLAYGEPEYYHKKNKKYYYG